MNWRPRDGLAARVAAHVLGSRPVCVGITPPPRSVIGRGILAERGLDTGLKRGTSVAMHHPPP